MIGKEITEARMSEIRNLLDIIGVEHSKSRSRVFPKDRLELQIMSELFAEVERLREECASHLEALNAIAGGPEGAKEYLRKRLVRKANT